MKDFATYLKEAREEAGLNQSELAGAVGLTGSYISVLESRRKPPPSDPVLRRLARALGRPEDEILEVAHLDRTPEDIRKKIRALDRHLTIERKLTRGLLSDILPSSLWHFWQVRGYQEAGLEKVRLDARKKRILRKVLNRIGHLTARADFEEESRLVIETLPAEDRAVLAEVLPELVRGLPDAEPGPARNAAPAAATLPLYRVPRSGKSQSARAALAKVAVAPEDAVTGRYFLKTPDSDMSPRVEEGDLLLVDPAAPPTDGALALVRIDKRVTVREIHAAKQGYLLVAANAATAKAGKKGVLGLIIEIRRRLHP